MPVADLALLDTVAGLPVHVLAVHGVVVLLPVACLATAAVAAVPRWRRAAWPVVGLDAVALVASLVARESGEALQARLGGRVALEHAERGDVLPLFAAGLLVAAALVALARGRGRGVLAAAAALAVVAAAAALAWTVLTGHSGSEAVWGDLVRATEGQGPSSG